MILLLYRSNPLSPLPHQTETKETSVHQTKRSLFKWKAIIKAVWNLNLGCIRLSCTKCLFCNAPSSHSLICFVLCFKNCFAEGYFKIHTKLLFQIHLKIAAHTETFKAPSFSRAHSAEINVWSLQSKKKKCKQTLEKRQRIITIQQWIIFFSFQQLLKQTVSKETCDTTFSP